MFLPKVLFICMLIHISICEPPSSNYGVPLNNFNNANYGTNDHDHNEPKSYEFGYSVKDEYTGNDYKRRETSDGNQVTGEYRVQLPDGRTQIVTYYADWQSGFHADVRYEGTASYPEQFGNEFSGGFSGPSAQYGAPGGQISNQYGAPFGSGNGGFNHASSSVSIKDLSGPGTPYNTNAAGYRSGNQQGGGHNGFDSYANAGNFGNRPRPINAYGAP